MTIVLCRHCGHRKAHTRGLCQTCHRNLEIRARYPAKRPDPRAATQARMAKVRAQREYEPTADEVDVTIFEQKKHLPPWWERESQRLAQAEQEGKEDEV